MWIKKSEFEEIVKISEEISRNAIETRVKALSLHGELAEVKQENEALSIANSNLNKELERLSRDMDNRLSLERVDKSAKENIINQQNKKIAALTEELNNIHKTIATSPLEVLMGEDLPYALTNSEDAEDLDFILRSVTLKYAHNKCGLKASTETIINSANAMYLYLTEAMNIEWGPCCNNYEPEPEPKKGRPRKS